MVCESDKHKLKETSGSNGGQVTGIADNPALLTPLVKRTRPLSQGLQFSCSAQLEDGKMANRRERSLIIPWVYDTVLWLFSILVDLFFREIHPRGAWRVPRKGPIIVVAAPHANQVSTASPLSLLELIPITVC